MRSSIDLGPAFPFVSEALRNEKVFLYQRTEQGAVLAVGEHERLEQPRFRGHRASDWCFGHMSYAQRHPAFGLPSPPTANNAWPIERWFVPEWVLQWKDDRVLLHTLPWCEEHALQVVAAMQRSSPGALAPLPILWEPKVRRAEYLQQARRLMEHIQRGDIYEVNYCMERTASAPDFDPFRAFERLAASTRAPFASFYRLENLFALCASPERFLRFDGSSVFAEPMKGTRPRSPDPVKDERLKQELASDGKERSENVMALDVVRHDLSCIATERSVVVEELCAVRSYPRVHQLVSKVRATVKDRNSPMDVVAACFPMASMTGAPKRRAMQLIADVEEGVRGLYSGTLAHFAPDGSGELNVIIRTVLFDSESALLSLSTGSALTAQCDPLTEWEECELKARSVIDAMNA